MGATGIFRDTELKSKADGVGGLVGLLVFLGGLGLLAFVFRETTLLFSKPPTLALGVQANGSMNVDRAADQVFALLWRIGTLLVMVIVASVIASRGIKMYQASRAPAEAESPKTKPDQR